MRANLQIAKGWLIIVYAASTVRVRVDAIQEINSHGGEDRRIALRSESNWHYIDVPGDIHAAADEIASAVANSQPWSRVYDWEDAA